MLPLAQSIDDIKRQWNKQAGDNRHGTTFKIDWLKLDNSTAPEGLRFIMAADQTPCIFKFAVFDLQHIRINVGIGHG
ncbi:MAG: hypothetical protein EBV03_07560 [Proteobacteria bacterium]|nr:hypothetical protein [Pseudomonadota bacterium]